jgi:hypothetical protein
MESLLIEVEEEEEEEDIILKKLLLAGATEIGVLIGREKAARRKFVCESLCSLCIQIMWGKKGGRKYVLEVCVSVLSC